MTGVISAGSSETHCCEEAGPPCATRTTSPISRIAGTAARPTFRSADQPVQHADVGINSRSADSRLLPFNYTNNQQNHGFITSPPAIHLQLS